MAAIGVNFKTLSGTAEGMNSFCVYQNGQMSKANLDIQSMLASDWTGEDAKEFSQKWADIYAKGSQSAKLHNSLIKFSEFLTICIKEYRAAQLSAVERASELRDALLALSN